jgi:hypothetical protein
MAQGCEQLRGSGPEGSLVNKGYKGSSRMGGTEIFLPIIGHIKTDNRLYWNFLKGVIGDVTNAMLRTPAFNFRKWMRKLKNF